MEQEGGGFGSRREGKGSLSIDVVEDNVDRRSGVATVHVLSSPPREGSSSPGSPGLRGALRKSRGAGSPLQSFIQRNGSAETKSKLTSSYGTMFKPSKRRSSVQHFSAVRKANKELQELKAKNEEQSYEQEQQDQEVIRKIRTGLHGIHKRLSAISILSILLAVGINEICSAVDYAVEAPPEAVLLEIEEGDGRLCPSSLGNPLKILQTFLTVVLFYFIARKYVFRLEKKVAKRWMTDRKIAGRQMPSFGQGAAVMLGSEPGSDKSALWVMREGPTKMKVKMIVEMLLFSAHTIPFYENDYTVQLLGTKIFYRFESILCCAMMLRLYHVWKWIYLSAFLHYFDTHDTYAVQDARTIEMLRQAHIRKHMLAIKVVVARRPLLAILVTIFTVILTGSYLLRIAEGPAYQQHSVYFWDQMWIAITQGTTGYGGSEPKTHMGRFVSVIMMFSGPIFVAFVTATVTRFLSLSAEERTLVMQMDKNRVQKEVLEAASLLIQFWWRRLHQHRNKSDAVEDRQVGLSRLASVRTGIVRGAFAGGGGTDADLSLGLRTQLWRNFYIAIDHRRKLEAVQRWAQVGAAAEQPETRRSRGLGDSDSDVGKILTAIQRVEKRVCHVEEGVRRVRMDLHGHASGLPPSSVRWSHGPADSRMRDDGSEGLSSVLPPRQRQAGADANDHMMHRRQDGDRTAAKDVLPHGADPKTSIRDFLPLSSAENSALSQVVIPDRKWQHVATRSDDSQTAADRTRGVVSHTEHERKLSVDGGHVNGLTQSEDARRGDDGPENGVEKGGESVPVSRVRHHQEPSTIAFVLHSDDRPGDESDTVRSGGFERPPKRKQKGRHKAPLGGWESDVVFSKEPRNAHDSRRLREAFTPPPAHSTRNSEHNRASKRDDGRVQARDQRNHAILDHDDGRGSGDEGAGSGLAVGWSLTAHAPRGGRKKSAQELVQVIGFQPATAGAVLADDGTVWEEPETTASDDGGRKLDGVKTNGGEVELRHRRLEASLSKLVGDQPRPLIVHNKHTRRSPPRSPTHTPSQSQQQQPAGVHSNPTDAPSPHPTPTSHLALEVANWASAVREATPAPPSRPDPSSPSRGTSELSSPVQHRPGTSSSLAAKANPREPTPGLVHGSELLRQRWSMSPSPGMISPPQAEGRPDSRASSSQPRRPSNLAHSVHTGVQGRAEHLGRLASGISSFTTTGDAEQRSGWRLPGWDRSAHHRDAAEGSTAAVTASGGHSHGLPRIQDFDRARLGPQAGVDAAPGSKQAQWTPRNGQGTPRNEARRWQGST